MKKLTFAIIILSLSLISFAQEKKLYDPSADAEKDIAAAVKKPGRKINLCCYRVAAIGAAGVLSLQDLLKLIRKSTL